MHLCSLCCAPRCCARNGWTESHDHFPDSANAPAILPNESYNFNNSLSRIPNSKKKILSIFSSLRFSSCEKIHKVQIFRSFCPDSIPHSINETWIVVEIFFIDPGRRRAREEDPSRRLVIQPAATMLCVSSKEEEEAVLQPRRRKGEARSQSGEGGQATTSSTNLDGARVQVGSTGWWCHSISPFSKNTNCRKWRQRTLVLAACCCCCCCTKRSTCRALLLLLLVFLWGYRDR